MKVRDVLVPLASSVHPDDSIRDALERMRELDIDPVPVTEGGKLVGVLVATNVEQRAAEAGLGAGSIQVREVMTDSGVCISADDDVERAREVLAGSRDGATFGRFPVVDAGGTVIGTVSHESLERRSESDAPDAGTAAIFAVESIDSLADINADRVDYTSDESFPASDPPPTSGAVT